MSNNLQFHCTINNRGSVPLKVKETHHDWGRWYPEESNVPIDIPAKQTAKAFASSGRTGAAAGTEGYVIYQLGDEKEAWVKIYWDVPWAPGSSNRVNVEVSHDDIIAAVEGFVGSGATESVIIKVLDGRE